MYDVSMALRSACAAVLVEMLQVSGFKELHLKYDNRMVQFYLTFISHDVEG